MNTIVSKDVYNFNFRNPRLPCQVLPAIDLTLWKDNQQGCNINGHIVEIGESHLPSPCTSCICTQEGVIIIHLLIINNNNNFKLIISPTVLH